MGVGVERSLVRVQTSGQMEAGAERGGGMMEWKDVLKVHGTVAGISVRGGRAVSILCNPGKGGRYPDKIEPARITYFVGGDTPQNGVSGLLRMVGSNESVRVFEKVSVNRWRDLGEWIAHDVGETTPDGYVAVSLVRRS